MVVVVVGEGGGRISLNFKFVIVAKGLLRAIFDGMLF